MSIRSPFNVDPGQFKDILELIISLNLVSSELVLVSLRDSLKPIPEMFK